MLQVFPMSFNLMKELGLPGRIDLRRSDAVESQGLSAESPIFRAGMCDYMMENCIHWMVWLRYLDAQLLNATFRLRRIGTLAFLLLALNGAMTLRVVGAEEELAPLRPASKPLAPLEDTGPKSWTAWSGISKFRGESRVLMNGGHQRSGDGFTKELNYSSWTQVSMELELAEDTLVGATQLFWKVVDANGTAGSSRSERDTANFGKTVRINNGQGGFGGKFSLRTQPGLMLNLKTGEWSFMTLKEPVSPGTETTTWSWRDWDKTGSGTDTIEFKSFEHAWIKGTAPESLGPLGAQAQFSEPGSATADAWTRTGYANFWPVYQDVELKLYIEKYAAWRPEGNIDAPKRAGGPGLQVIAVLRSKDPKKKTPPAINELSFDLTNTSTEPGVCLNWPLNARDEDSDLRLAVPDGLGAVASTDAEGRILAYEQLIPVQVNGVEEQGGIARIDSFDFGGKTVLKVFARLRDGRQIVGEFDAHPDGMVAAVELPYVKGRGWVPEVWLNAKAPGLREDRDDSEKTPEGDGNNGDGFTLYEEYRGWVVDGRHVEGDPKLKELFVQNLGEPEILNGVTRFESITDLKVHRLKTTEMNPRTRLMNGNRRNGPTKVEQHGIVLRTDPSLRGGQTDMINAAANTMPGRPKYVKQIRVGPRTPPEGNLAPPTVKSIAGFHESMVAHELLHAVGVEHHGEGDRTVPLSFRFADDPRFPGSEPGFWETIAFVDFPVKVLEEQTGANYAQQFAAAAEKLRQSVRDYYGQDIRATVTAGRAAREGYKFDYTADQMVEILINSKVSESDQSLILGAWQGQSSGDVGCVMRYYFSVLFQKRGDEKTYYKITPSSEPIGAYLCTSAEGTGINEAQRSPQSRYGPAAVGRGNCRAQICVNDAIPPKKK